MNFDLQKTYPSGEARLAAMRAACEPAAPPPRSYLTRPSWNWHDTGLGGCCGACEEAGHVLSGHFACSTPVRVTGGVAGETTSEYDGQAWRLLAFCSPATARRNGWEEAS